MKYFKFVWQDGKVEYKNGSSVQDAFHLLGYGAGALTALDFWSQISEEEYKKETEEKQG